MIGGGAMSFRGDKESTKDVDWVVENKEDLEMVISALKESSFHKVTTLPEEYINIGATIIMRDEEGFQCDLYLGQVCNAMYFSESMINRAEYFQKFGNLNVYLASREDIFLFKGITEREKDLDDMLSLLRTGLDHNIIINECLFQSRNSPKVWESFVVLKLDELERRFNIEIPWKKKLRRLAEESIAENIIKDIIKDGHNTVKEICDKTMFSDSWVRNQLKLLLDKNSLNVNKKKRPYEYEIVWDD